MQVCNSSDVSGWQKPPFKRDVTEFGAGHLRNPISPTDGRPGHGLLCDAFATFVQATTALSGLCLCTAWLLARSAVAGQNNRVNDAGGAWNIRTRRGDLWLVTKSSVICTKAPLSTRASPRRHPRGFTDRTAVVVALGRVDVLRGSNSLRRPEAQMQCRVSKLPRC